MHMKLLLFACLVLLISVTYFIYTTLNQPTLTEEQQQTTQESNENLAKHVSRVNTPELGQEQLTSAETEDKQAFEQPFQESFEEAESEELASAPEMGTDDTEIDSEISPELETLFIVVNEWRNKNVAHGKKTVPFMREYAALSDIERELIFAIDGTSGEENQRLHEELRQVQSGKQDIADTLEPFDREKERAKRELEEYLRTNYGLTIKAFFDRYREDFDSWRQAQ